MIWSLLSVSCPKCVPYIARVKRCVGRTSCIATPRPMPLAISVTFSLHLFFFNIYLVLFVGFREMGE